MSSTPSDCGCGWVLFVSGSGGVTGNNLRFGKMAARLGFGYVAPDTFSEATFSNGYFHRTRYKTPTTLTTELLQVSQRSINSESMLSAHVDFGSGVRGY